MALSKMLVEIEPYIFPESIPSTRHNLKYTSFLVQDYQYPHVAWNLWLGARARATENRAPASAQVVIALPLRELRR